LGTSPYTNPRFNPLSNPSANPNPNPNPLTQGTQTYASRATALMDNLVRNVSGDLEGDDLLRVIWLSGTLFFVVGGYWLLRSLKDPIMSVIDGVSEAVLSNKISLAV
jgi:AAA family ATP:ADP antiporter